MKPILVRLFKEMSELTEPECGRCRAPYSCCSPEYCEMAEEYAAEDGATLVPTAHPTLKFMSPSGCVVPPHYRPLCTLHTCDINSIGVKPGDDAWTSLYFALRERLEAELAKGTDDQDTTSVSS
jgi:hypothetical protein